MTPAAPDGHDRDTPMTGTYVAVVVLEATIVALLYLLGRIYT